MLSGLPARRWRRSGVTLRALLVLLAITALVLGACSAQTPAPPAKSGAAATPAPSGTAAPAPAAEPPTPDRLVPTFKALIPTQGYFPEVHEAGNLLVEEMKKLGFRFEVINFPTFQAYTDLWRKTADWGLGMAGYVPREDRLDPDEMLKFWTCAEAKEGGRNEANYCSPDFEKAYGDQVRLMDPNQRRPAVQKAQEVMARDLPALTMMHQNLRHVYNQEKFTNIVTIPGVGTWNSFNFMQATPLTSDRTYRVGYVAGLPALSPVLDNYGGLDHDVLRLVYDTLTRVGPDGTPQPWAAEKWQQVDDKTLDLTLRQGMKFHDGKPVTVDDVVFTFETMLRVKPVFYLSLIRPIDKVEKTSDRVVRVRLKAANAPLLLTTLGRIPIMPKHIWQGIAEPRKVTQVNLTGSGPFKMKNQKPEQSYQLERFNDYFMPAKVDEVLIVKYSNKETQFLDMAKGAAYFVEQKGLAAEQMQEVGKYPFLKVLTEPSIDVRYLVFNMRQGKTFEDYTLREAVAHLLDYKTIEEVIGKGLVQAGRGVIAPAHKFYHNAAIPSKEGDGVHYHQYDPAKARKILQDAGFQWDKDGKLYYPKNYKLKPLP